MKAKQIMSLTTADIARLASTIPARTRVADPAARELAKATIEQAKRAALEAATERAGKYLDYTDSQLARIKSLRAVHWPRTRAIRDALSACDDSLRRHADKHDDYSLSVVEYENVIIRACRLVTLLSRAYAASAAIGRFPVSRNDMRTDRRTRFIGSAAARHFTFAGGRDWGSAEFEPADIVQGAFVRALENGDSVDGVPTFGSMFRWIQSERARLTNMANAEYSARKRAALGHVESAQDEWEDTTHTLRLLDTRNYATTEDHRKALAIAHRDAEMAAMDDHVTRMARKDEISIANAEEFHVVLAEYLMSGNTLADIAQALGLTPETVASRALKSREDSMRRMSTGIDHAERSIDMHNAAEREREIDEAQARHAAIMRERYVTAQTAHYATARRTRINVDFYDAAENYLPSYCRDVVNGESVAPHIRAALSDAPENAYAALVTVAEAGDMTNVYDYWTFRMTGHK